MATTRFPHLEGIIEEFGDKEIKHYGIKGMKWGVRRALQKMPSSDRAAFLAEKDKKWLAKVEKNPKLDKISRKAAREAKRATKKLKADYKERGWNIKKDSLARSRYDTELKNILENSLEKAAYKVHKFPPSRLSEVRIYRHPDGSIDAVVGPRMNQKIVKQQAKINKADVKRVKAEEKDAARVAHDALAYDALTHADIVADDAEDDFQDLVFYLTVDDEGFVSDVMAPGEIEHSLMHYGVKGMRWGVRKRRSESSSTPVDPQPVTIRQNHKTKGLQAAGGAGHKPSDDALTAVAIRQKAKASGSASLSNKELEALVKRMNLEANYAKAMAANPAPQTNLAKGKKKLQDILKSEMNAAFKGQKGPYANFLGMAVGLGKEQVAKNATKKAAKKGAATVATKVLVGRVVN